MKITKITGGPLPTNCYLLTDEATGQTAVIDPGFESAELTEAVRHAGLDYVPLILLTHGHFDHITGVAKVRELTGAKVAVFLEERMVVSDRSLNLSGMVSEGGIRPFPVDLPLSDGETVELGKLKITVLHTPGHTVGSCCFLAEDALFSGDTLMKLSYGRTDFPTGNGRQMRESLRKLRDLPGDFHVYPGHGSETSLGFERKYNSFLGEDA